MYFSLRHSVLGLFAQYQQAQPCKYWGKWRKLSLVPYFKIVATNLNQNAQRGSRERRKKLWGFQHQRSGEGRRRSRRWVPEKYLRTTFICVFLAVCGTSRRAYCPHLLSQNAFLPHTHLKPRNCPVYNIGLSFWIRRRGKKPKHLAT